VKRKGEKREKRAAYWKQTELPREEKEMSNMKGKVFLCMGNTRRQKKDVQGQGTQHGGGSANKAKAGLLSLESTGREGWEVS